MMKQTSETFHDIWKSMGGSGISARMAPKKASDAFLNHQFGWIPFLSDMQKFYSAYQNTAKYMSTMSHGNDQWKVYRRTLADDIQVTKVASGNGWRVTPFGVIHEQLFCSGTARWELWEEKSTLVTTSGMFKWYKPEFDLTNPEYNSAWNSMGRQMAMYGARISPSNVWRATPWTWLIDWGLNIGRSIDRVTEYLQDGVVCKYLYLMHHTVRRQIFRQYLPFKTGGVTLEFVRLVDVKQRSAAGSPYGFGTSWDSLNPKKLAILAALGISRFS
jgi:hypothetical protein